MDLFGSTKTTSLNGKKYRLVIVDNISRYIWNLFLTHKDEILSIFLKFYRKILNKKNSTIVYIRNDYGMKFKNKFFEDFCNENEIERDFSASRTPQQNSIIERKNSTLVDMACTILYEGNLFRYF